MIKYGEKAHGMPLNYGIWLAGIAGGGQSPLCRRPVSHLTGRRLMRRKPLDD